MHLLAISLLAILAGTLLLSKFRKENAGKFFGFISWFFIVVGFILFIGFIIAGIYRVSYYGLPCKEEYRHEMMMKNCSPDRMKMDMGRCMHHPMMPGYRMKGDSTMKGCCMKGDSIAVKH